MSEELKKQLLGLLVLFILFGLLWVLLFSNDRSTDDFSSELTIPEVISLGDIKVLNAEPSYSIENNKKPKNNFRKKDESLDSLISTEPLPPPIAGVIKNTVSPEKRPRLDKNGLPVSFVIQVGSFDEYKNADNLRDTLIDNYKMKAFLKPSTAILKPPYIVYVGPVLTYEDALSTKSDLQQIIIIRDLFIKRFGDH